MLKLLKGFESKFSLEILASVNFVSAHDRKKNVEELVKNISNSGERKASLFNDKYVKIAYDHLMNYSSGLVST